MRRALVSVVAAALLLGGLAQAPLLAGTTATLAAGAVPAEVTSGTGTLYTSDNCGFDQPSSAVWVYSLDLTLALRLDGRLRTMSLASPWLGPPNWPDYRGERGVPCDYVWLPTMSFTGSVTTGTDLTGKPVSGYCWGRWGLGAAVHYHCRLSMQGRAPFDLRMRLTDVYDDYQSEHGAGEDDNITFAVSGVQDVVPS